MGDVAYDWLTGMDGSFLAFENPNAPMHVASLQIHEATPLRLPGGELDIERLREYLLSRLHLIPRYRQRLEYAPVTGLPVWVDDARFNITYHLRHSKLPQPGSLRQLKRTAARILSQQLDRGKPLWEMWVIEGLEGDRFAVISKVHHCMIDGVAGSELLAVLMTAEPTTKVDAPKEWVPRTSPSPLRLATDQALRWMSVPFRVLEFVSQVALDRDNARGELAERLRAAGRMLSSGMERTSNTPINQPIGPHRRIDWIAMDMDRIKAIRHVSGSSINDVVLAIATGAIRSFLQRNRHMSVEDLDFRVMAPVSVRREDEHDEMGNHVSAWIVRLPIAEPEPLVRLQTIRETTAELKRTRQAQGAEILTEAAAWTGPAFLSLGSRLMSLGQPFNLVVTNVPGPPFPLYLLESRMLEVIPMVPLMGTLTTGIALFSYDGQLYWGVIADWDRVPDLHDLVLALDEAFEELANAAEGATSDPGTD